MRLVWKLQVMRNYYYKLNLCSLDKGFLTVLRSILMGKIIQCRYTHYRCTVRTWEVKDSNEEIPIDMELELITSIPITNQDMKEMIAVYELVAGEFNRRISFQEVDAVSIMI